MKRGLTTSAVRWIIVATGSLFLLVSYLDAKGQELPAAPSPTALMKSAVLTKPVSQPLFTKSELRDADELFAVNMGDWWTTEHFLAHGGEEGELPTALVENKYGFLAFKMAEVGGEVYLEHRFDRLHYAHRHRWFRIATRASVQATVALTARVDVNNYQYASHLHAAPSSAGTPVMTRPSLGGAL